MLSLSNFVLYNKNAKYSIAEYHVFPSRDLAYDGAPVGMTQLRRQRNKAAYPIERDESPVAPGEPLQGQSILRNIGRERTGGST